jgi:PAS domain-containing protein
LAGDEAQLLAFVASDRPIYGLLDQSRGATVAQHPVELILVRQLAVGLAVPTFVVDAAGDLVFVNEAAEALLGLDFEDVGDVSFAEWTTAFASRTKGRKRADPATHPLAVAIRKRTAVHGPLRIVGRDGVLRSLVVTALPLEGSRGQLLGGLAMFWEPPAP